MKKILALCLFFCIISFGNTVIAQSISQRLKNHTFKKHKPLERVKVQRKIPHLKKSVQFYLNTQVDSIINEAPEFTELTIDSVTIDLFKVDISPNVVYSDGKLRNTPKIVNYRGKVKGEDSSLIALTFSQGEVSGMINRKSKHFNLERMEGENTHLLYDINDVDSLKPFTCETFIPPSVKTFSAQELVPASQASKCVQWFWETDYDIFASKGTGTLAHMQGLFNQNATIYANDGFSISLKTLFIWTTEDPYTGPTTSSYLNQFGNYRGQGGVNGFTTVGSGGDMAHLIGYKGGGGIAWVGTLCYGNLSGRMAYSAISSSYSQVPTYSWTVDCIAHEEGHNFGSNHTHDCVWNGNSTAIDGCGPAAGYSSGSCPVVPLSVTQASGGGTIMSYCHLNIGKNFTLGFGPQPKALMQWYVNNATCLTSCTNCPIPAKPNSISGNATVLKGSSQTYSVALVPLATSYTWTLPVGWIGSSSINSITATAGNSGNISVTANDSCGNSAPQTLSVTVNNPCVGSYTPTLVITSSATVIDSGTAITVSKQSGTHLGTSPQFFVNYGGVVVATGLPFTFKPAVSNSLLVTATSNDTCMAQTNCTSNTINITVNKPTGCPNPFDEAAKITPTQKPTYWLLKANGKFMNDRFYIWNTGQKTQIINVPLSPGTYSVTMTAVSKPCIKNNVATITIQ